MLLSFAVFCWWVVWGFGGCCLVFVLSHALDLPETSEQMYLFMNYKKKKKRTYINVTLLLKKTFSFTNET